MRIKNKGRRVAKHLITGNKPNQNKISKNTPEVKWYFGSALSNAEDLKKDLVLISTVKEEETEKIYASFDEYLKEHLDVSQEKPKGSIIKQIEAFNQKG